MANNEPAGSHNVRCPAEPEWRTRFLEALAATSNIDRALAAAQVSLVEALRARRDEPEFARAWQAAIADAYLGLELEIVRRLREGDGKTGDGDKFDFANAIRLLAAHRDSAGRGQNQVRDVSAAEVRASIDRKIEDIRRRIARRKAEAEGQDE